MRGPCRRQSMSRDLTRRTFPASASDTAAVVHGAPGVASLLTCLLLGQAAQAHADTTAQAPAAGELKRLSVEELMNVEVTSVAKEPQRLLQAAASIQVITAQDIRRSGATSIPEALRLADNLQVSQINAHDWAISARGFNTNLANKLLVLIDGRAVYTPLYGGVLWDVQDYLLEDIDRIEVISGPGGTLWGGDAGRSGANVLGRWTHAAASGASMSVQVYYDHTYLSQPFAAAPPNPPFFAGFPAASLTDDLNTTDVDFQYHFGWGTRQKLAWGLGYRSAHETDNDLSLVRFTPSALDQALYSGFLQDEIQLARGVYLTVGSKLEHNDYTGYEVEPSGRVQWSLDSRQLLWAAISRAVRTPSRYDRDLLIPSGLINPPPPLQFPAAYLQGSADFHSEALVAYEAGYRAELAPGLTGSLSAFYNDYHDLRSATATPTTATYVFPYPVYFQNNVEGDTYGLELSGSYQLRDGWRLHAGYDLLRESIHAEPGRSDATGATNETADPQQQLALRSSMDLPHAVTLDAALRWVDTVHINNGPTGGPVTGTVPSYFGLDSRLAWRVNARLEVSVVGQNLLHARHIEYGFPLPLREQIVRSVFGKITWAY